MSRANTRLTEEPPFSGAAAESGALLRAARAKAGMSRRQLAQSSGASERYLAVLESGEGNPTVAVLAALARALNAPLAALLPDGGERDARLGRIAAAVRALPEGRLAGLEEWLSAPPPRQAARARRVVLTGLRGAGKTTLGQMAAEHLGVPFIEMSKRVEESYGGDIGLLIELGGQAALRRHEAEVWESVIAAHPAAVIAASGSVVADEGLYSRMLETAHAVWLRATPEEHMSRVMAQGDFRPMAGNRGAMADLKAILAARSADYGRAQLHFDTSGLGVEAAAGALSERIREMLEAAGAGTSRTGKYAL